MLNENRAALTALLRRLGIRPRRENGQNFLIDGAVAEDLVEAAGVAAGETVLEIGPGLGAVTGVLVERGARVIAVELDEKLSSWLTAKYAGNSLVQVINGNVLKLKLGAIVKDGGYKLVSSLPFNITSIVLRNFLEYMPRPSRIALLIQKEVAERVIAGPGEMSILSVSSQYLSRPRIIREVPAISFYPEPEVDGAILEIDVGPLPSPEERQKFFRIVHIGFSSKRKMLVNNLAVGLRLPKDEIVKILEKTGISTTIRAEGLSVSQWKTLMSEFV